MKSVESNVFDNCYLLDEFLILSSVDSTGIDKGIIKDAAEKDVKQMDAQDIYELALKSLNGEDEEKADKPFKIAAHKDHTESMYEYAKTLKYRK